MKHLIAGLFAGALAFSSMSALAADETTTAPQAETKTEKTKKYVGKKARAAKEGTKRAAKKTKAKVKDAVANRKATDPASPNESQPAATR